ncbi:phosphotransferase family protein [Longispora albida]|uniref:phosphotransferase family protein n=1 Tax=Longispora albida TaxID=203523 RepID=UPI00036017AB|nr:aminoglycoside phosphotransferase family protein [Longispora albida]
MDLRSVPRKHDDFQRPLAAETIEAMCRQTFGVDTVVTSAVELDGGMYNSTYCVTLDGHAAPVILRVAPEPPRQRRSERQLMRTEYATLPYLASLGPLVPRVLGADFTGSLINRDHMFQNLLPGVPAPKALRGYDHADWGPLFAQLGAITRRVHDVRGPHFGPIAGPGHTTWSEAVVAMFADLAADVDDLGLDSADLWEVIDLVSADTAVLDEITEPRLLHGDLWTTNILLARDAPSPVITGVLDADRALWGDPAADWPIRMAQARPGREAFWTAYGPPDITPAGRWRAAVYEARHLAALRLERHRRSAADEVSQSYVEMAAVLTQLVTSRPE